MQVNPNCSRHLIFSWHRETGKLHSCHNILHFATQETNNKPSSAEWDFKAVPPWNKWPTWLPQQPSGRRQISQKNGVSSRSWKKCSIVGIWRILKLALSLNMVNNFPCTIVAITHWRMTSFLSCHNCRAMDSVLIITWLSKGHALARALKIKIYICLNLHSPCVTAPSLS